MPPLVLVDITADNALPNDIKPLTGPEYVFGNVAAQMIDIFLNLRVVNTTVKDLIMVFLNISPWVMPWSFYVTLTSCELGPRLQADMKRDKRMDNIRHQPQCADCNYLSMT